MRPHPSDPRACWHCWGERREWIQIHVSDDGEDDWDEVPCTRCHGTGKEPARAEAAE